MSSRRQGVAQGKIETKRGCSQVRPGQAGGRREAQAIRSETAHRSAAQGAGDSDNARWGW